MQKKSAILLIFLVLICLALLLIIAVKKSEITGLAIYLSKPSYASNERLSGSYELSLREGELIPLDSIALIQLADQQRNLTLEEWLELSNASYPLGFGSFYLENKSLSGEGMGLGRPGKLIEKPSISFKLKIFEISQSQASNESEEKDTFSTFSVGNIGNIGGASVFNPINPLSFLYFISALKSLLGFTIAEQLEASVSADKPFIYEIPPGYDAEIIEESINIDGSPASIELLQISKQGSILTIKTNYTIEKIGFGPEFLGEAYTIPLSLDVLNLQAQDGTLEIKLVYANETLFYDQEQITTQATAAPAQIQEFQIQQTCYCDSCSNCTAQLNNPLCSEVLLTADITNFAGTCIDNPENFSNKVFDCQGHTIDGDDNGTDYGIYLSEKTNNTIKNCIVTDFYFGIYFYNSSNNTLANNIANSNYYFGIYLYSSSNNTLINNTANSNKGDLSYIGSGILLSYSSNNTLINNNASLNNNFGIDLSYSSNNTLINNTASSNSNGIYLDSSSNNTLTNNTASSNSEDGIYLGSSSNNNLISNTANSNGGSGIYLGYSSSDNIVTNNIANNNSRGINVCGAVNSTIANNTMQENVYVDLEECSIGGENCLNNIFENNTCSGDRLCGVYNYPVNLVNQEFSDLIMCNATGSNITNVTVKGSETLFNNAVRIFFSDNLLIQNLTSSGNAIGIALVGSNNITIINSTANYNNGGFPFGLVIFGGGNHTINNSEFNFNGAGIRLLTSSNILTNNTANSNMYGIYLSSSSSNILINNTARNNSDWDFYSESDSIGNIITNLNIGPIVSFEGKDIALRNASAPAADPAGWYNISKYVNATNNSADSWLFLNISYDESEIDSVSEASLRIWKYNDSWYNEGFYTINGVDTTNNVVYANITSFSIFAPLGIPPCYCDSCSNCTAQLNDPACSEVLLTADITNFAGTCINNPENFSNKIFDCQGHKIDGDDSGADHGIDLSGKTNNTIKNCVITDFFEGIYLYGVSNSIFTNNTVNSNNLAGIYLGYFSSNNTLINNIVNSNTYGIDVVVWSNNNILTNNTASSNDYGIILLASSNNILTRNIIKNSTYYDLYVDNSSANNSIFLNNFLSKGIKDELYSFDEAISNYTISYSPMHFNGEDFYEEIYAIPAVGCYNITADGQIVNVDGVTNIDLILVNDSANPACGWAPGGLREVFCQGCYGLGITNCSILEALLGLNPGDCRYFKASAFVAGGYGSNYTWNDSFNDSYYVIPGYTTPPYLNFSIIGTTNESYNGTNIYCVNNSGNWYDENARPLKLVDCGKANVISISISGYIVNLAFVGQDSALSPVYYDLFLVNASNLSNQSFLMNTTSTSLSIDLSGYSAGTYKIKIVPFVLGSRYNGTIIYSEPFTLAPAQPPPPTPPPTPTPNHAPEIIAYKPEDLSIAIQENDSLVFYAKARDADNDSLIMKFYLNDNEVNECQDVGEVECGFNFKEASGSYSIKAEVSDGEASNRVEWQVTVIKCIDEWNCSEWGPCINGTMERRCVKVNPECPSEEHKPSESQACVVPIEKCVLAYCENWSECKLERASWKELLAGKITYYGKQKRICYCKDGRNYSEEQDCVVYKELKVEKGFECGVVHYYVKDKATNKILAKIKMPSFEKGLDIHFVIKESELGYCWYCFDGKQDYDETGIDCGGPCKPCVEKPAVPAKAKKFNYLPVIIISILFVSGLAWLTLKLLKKREIVAMKRKLKEMSIFRK